MSPGFETGPQKSSSEDVSKKLSKESTESYNSNEAFVEAEDLVEDFTGDLNEKAGALLEEDTVVQMKGREFKLGEEISNEHWEIGLIQKRVQVIENKLQAVLDENSDSQPGGREEAVTYFAAQILGRLKETEKKRAALEASRLGFKLQHPDIYQALDQQIQNQEGIKQAVHEA